MTKIAILSDIHVGKFGRGQEFAVSGEINPDNVKGAPSLVDGLIEIVLEQKVGYLFVTGDLTSTGAPLEYSKCDKILQTILNKTSIPEKNLVLCLGNHDFDRRIEAISEQFKSKVTCEKIQKKLQSAYQTIAVNFANHFLRSNCYDTQGPVPYSGILKRDSLTIFVLNSSSMSSQYEKVPHGKVTKKQLDWLKVKLEESKDNKGWKILLLHHHPFSYPFPRLISDLSLLEEGSELLEIAGENGIDLICHGHRHHPRAHSAHNSSWLNPIIFICAGSFSVNASHRDGGEIPNCFHIAELKDDKKKTLLLKTYQYTNSEGWTRLSKFTPETPLDADMYFSSPFTEEERENAFKKLLEARDKDGSCELPSWEDLPLELKTIRHQKLNELIDKLIPTDSKKFGDYPDNVGIWRSE